jgi:hypothetical protein
MGAGGGMEFRTSHVVRHIRPDMLWWKSLIHTISTSLHSGLMGRDAVWLVKWFPTLRRNVLPSSSRVQGPWRMLTSLALFMDFGRFKMNATLSSESSGTTYPATHPHISEDLNPRLHHCENLKPCSVCRHWECAVKENLFYIFCCFNFLLNQKSSLLTFALFWYIAQRRMILPYQRFGTTCRSHLKRSHSSWTVSHLKMGPTGFLETWCGTVILCCVKSQKSAHIIYIAA